MSGSTILVFVVPSQYPLSKKTIKGISENCFWPPARRRGEIAITFYCWQRYSWLDGLLLVGPTPSGCLRENYRINRGPLKLTINGEDREILKSQNLEDLVQELEIQAPNFAMALNKQVIPRSKYATTQIQENDQVEIVHAVGGGV